MRATRSTDSATGELTSTLLEKVRTIEVLRFHRFLNLVHSIATMPQAKSLALGGCVSFWGMPAQHTLLRKLGEALLAVAKRSVKAGHCGTAEAQPVMPKSLAPTLGDHHEMIFPCHFHIMKFIVVSTGNADTKIK